MTTTSSATPDSDPVSTLDTSSEDVGLLDIALVFAENIRTLVFVPLGAGLVALVISFMITPSFTGTAKLMPPKQQQGIAAALTSQLGALAGIVGGAGGIRNPGDQYVGLLKSRTISDAMVEQFQLKELYKAELMEGARKELEDQTRITSNAKDGLITIEVDDHDPKRAADMANGYIEELQKLMKRLAVTEAGERRLFFEEQLRQAKDNLAKAEMELRQSGVSAATLRTVPAAALNTLSQLRAQITLQEIRIAALRASMTEANPEFRNAISELAALRAELSKAEERNSVGLSGDGSAYFTRYRNFKYFETLYDLMAKQYELARLEEARDGFIIQVVDKALRPERKSKPKKALIAVLTTLATLVVTALALLARAALNSLAKDDASSRKLSRVKQLVRLRRSEP